MSRFIFALAMASTPLLFAQCPKLEPLNFHTLRDAIENKGLNTIERVIECLPDSYKHNWTLIHHSKGAQDASYDNPRAILFGTDASFILAFNGHPEQAGYHRLETFQFEAKTQEIHMRDIMFASHPKNTSGTTLFSDPNPPQCAGCHLSSGRPIFAQYNQWPGAYGQDNDNLSDEIDKETSKSEKEHFFAFLEARHTHPRYKHLKQIEPDFKHSPFNYDHMRGYYQTRTNLRFMDFLFRYNARKIVAKLMKQKVLFEKYKYYLGFRIDSCAYRDIEDEDYYKIEKELKADLAKIGVAHNIAPLAHPYPYDIPKNLLKLFGIHRRAWSIEKSPKSWDYETGQGDFRKIVAGVFFAELAKRESGFSDEMSWEFLSKSYYDLFERNEPERKGRHLSILQQLDKIGGYSNDDSFKSRCKNLGKKISAQLE